MMLGFGSDSNRKTRTGIRENMCRSGRMVGSGFFQFHPLDEDYISKFLAGALNPQAQEHILERSLDIIWIQPWSITETRDDSINFLQLNTFRFKQGMASEDRNLVEILEENIPIDIAKYIKFVSAPQAGAISTFSGTTRDSFEGKTVVELRYEAYVPMAIRSLKSICSSARSSWNLHSIAVAHRLGPVPVGEISVFIAVSAVHRADAMDSCRFMIDELKASVPIWKKEVYDNGEVWKENSEFMDRRLELGNEGEVLLVKKSCCGSKVKVNEQQQQQSSEHDGKTHKQNVVENENGEDEVQKQQLSRKSCCGSKVKVNE